MAQLRGSNLHAITALLGSGGPQSRADLARGSGLSRTTVSSLVSEPLAAGIVVETADRGTPYKGGSGRPPLLVALALRPGGVAGVDIGHGHVRVAVSDRSASILAELEMPTDADHQGAATLDLAADLVRQAAELAGVPVADLLSVGLCVPGPIDRRSARVDHAVLPGWHELGSRGGARAPARSPGRGRQRREPRRDRRASARRRARDADVIYVKLATGVGAGLVLGGRLHRGATGIAGEIGHVHVRDDGEVCRCGNRGCLETRSRHDGCWTCCGPRTATGSTWTTRWRSARAHPCPAGAHGRRPGGRARPRGPEHHAQPRDDRRRRTARRLADTVEAIRESVDRYASPRRTRR